MGLSTDTAAPPTPNGGFKLPDSPTILNLALLQLPVDPYIFGKDGDGNSIDKPKTNPNVTNAVAKIQSVFDETSSSSQNQIKPDLLVLPEVWNGPYKATEFPKFAEEIPEVGTVLTLENSQSLGPIAESCCRKYQVPIVCGSIAEREEKNGKTHIFNTSVALDHEGRIIGKHRKVHLFDIDVKPDPAKGKPGMTFRESDTLTAGDSLTSFQLPIVKNMKANKDSDSASTSPPLPTSVTTGLAICYDIRFAEFMYLYRKPKPQGRDCKLIVIPAAFNTTTGPRHWHLCLRARATDTQCYVAACSPSRPEPEALEKDKGLYPAYGHSLLVNPWGAIGDDGAAELEEKPGVVFCQVDLEEVETVRNSLPTGFQRRDDVYRLEEVGGG